MRHYFVVPYVECNTMNIHEIVFKAINERDAIAQFKNFFGNADVIPFTPQVREAV